MRNSKTISDFSESQKSLITSMSADDDSKLSKLILPTGIKSPTSINTTKLHRHRTKQEEIITATPRITDIQLRDLKKVGIIGEGGQGVVEVVLHIPTNRLFAMKKIWLNLDDSEEAKKQQQLISLEVQTLIESESNKFVVKFIQAFYTTQQVQILLEYMDFGSLQDIYRSARKIPERILSKIAFHVLQGLKYLHNERHVVHRDIKPCNILVKRNGRVKIADLGVARRLDNDALAKTRLGTLTYLSPERLTDPNGYTYSSDIWSLGVSLVECALGEHPYSNATLFELLGRVQNPPIYQWLSYSEFSFEFITFISLCMKVEPKNRATADFLLSHPFILKYQAMEDYELADWVINRLPVNKFIA